MIKLIPFIFLVGCASPQYCGIDYDSPVVGYKPNPDVMTVPMHTQFIGQEFDQCNYYPQVQFEQSCGPLGWEKGLNYPYKN